MRHGAQIVLHRLAVVEGDHQRRRSRLRRGRICAPAVRGVGEGVHLLQPGIDRARQFLARRLAHQGLALALGEIDHGHRVHRRRRCRGEQRIAPAGVQAHGARADIDHQGAAVDLRVAHGGGAVVDLRDERHAGVRIAGTVAHERRALRDLFFLRLLRYIALHRVAALLFAARRHGDRLRADAGRRLVARGIERQAGDGAPACAVEPAAGDGQHGERAILDSHIDRRADVDHMRRLLARVGVGRIFGDEVEVRYRRVPDDAAEQPHVGPVEEFAEIDLAAAIAAAHVLAHLEGAEQGAERIVERAVAGEPAPAQSGRHVEVPDALGSDEIFAAVDAGADDVSYAERNVRHVFGFLEQPHLHAEAAVEVRHVAVEVRNARIAERAFQPRKQLKAERHARGLLQRADRQRQLSVVGHARGGRFDQAHFAIGVAKRRRAFILRPRRAGRAQHRESEQNRTQRRQMAGVQAAAIRPLLTRGIQQWNRFPEDDPAAGTFRTSPLSVNMIHAGSCSVFGCFGRANAKITTVHVDGSARRRSCHFCHDLHRGRCSAFGGLLPDLVWKRHGAGDSERAEPAGRPAIHP